MFRSSKQTENGTYETPEICIPDNALLHTENPGEQTRINFILKIYTADLQSRQRLADLFSVLSSNPYIANQKEQNAKDSGDRCRKPDQKQIRIGQRGKIHRQRNTKEQSGNDALNHNRR